MLQTDTYRLLVCPLTQHCVVATTTTTLCVCVVYSECVPGLHRAHGGAWLALQPIPCKRTIATVKSRHQASAARPCNEGTAARSTHARKQSLTVGFRCCGPRIHFGRHGALSSARLRSSRFARAALGWKKSFREKAQSLQVLQKSFMTNSAEIRRGGCRRNSDRFCTARSARGGK